MDARQETGFNILVQDAILSIFAHLDFRALRVLALVNSAFAKYAQMELENQFRHSFPRNHNFLVSTREGSSIHWEMEYENTKSEFERKAKSLPLNSLTLTTTNRFDQLFELWSSESNPNSSFWRDEKYFLYLVWLGREEQIPIKELDSLPMTKLFLKGSDADISSSGESNEGLLFGALQWGRLSIVKAFYEKKLFNNASVLKDDKTVLDLASKFGHLSVCQYLWDLEIVELKKPIHEQTMGLHSRVGRALQTLFVYSHEQLLKYCLDQDIECYLNFTIQVMPGDGDVIAFREDDEPKWDGKIRSMVYQCLIWSVEANALSVLKRLLKKYPDQIYQDCALYQAAKQNQLELFKYLCTHTSASLEFVMNFDLLDSRVPLNISLFQIAAFFGSDGVERYLFLKLTLPDLTLDLDQIDQEDNLDVLLKAFKVIDQTMDARWETYLGSKTMVLDFEDNDDEDENLAPQEKPREYFYHSEKKFFIWLSDAADKIVKRITFLLGIEVASMMAQPQQTKTLLQGESLFSNRMTFFVGGAVPFPLIKVQNPPISLQEGSTSHLQKVDEREQALERKDLVCEEFTRLYPSVLDKISLIEKRIGEANGDDFDELGDDRSLPWQHLYNLRADDLGDNPSDSEGAEDEEEVEEDENVARPRSGRP